MGRITRIGLVIGIFSLSLLIFIGTISVPDIYYTITVISTILFVISILITQISSEKRINEFLDSLYGILKTDFRNYDIEKIPLFIFYFLVLTLPFVLISVFVLLPFFGVNIFLMLLIGAIGLVIFNYKWINTQTKASLERSWKYMLLIISILAVFIFPSYYFVDDMAVFGYFASFLWLQVFVSLSFVIILPDHIQQNNEFQKLDSVWVKIKNSPNTILLLFLPVQILTYTFVGFASSTTTLLRVIMLLGPIIIAILSHIVTRNVDYQTLSKFVKVLLIPLMLPPFSTFLYDDLLFILDEIYWELFFQYNLVSEFYSDIGPGVVILIVIPTVLFTGFELTLFLNKNYGQTTADDLQFPSSPVQKE